MEQTVKSNARSEERRYVLADRFLPKTSHDVDTSESRSFGNGTPATRKTTDVAPARKDGELQDSIKAILSKFE